MPIPTVGRIVHFYDQNAEPNDTHRKGVEISGQGKGPFAAIIVQAHSDRMVSLRVFAYGGEFTESSVDFVNEGDDPARYKRYAVFPPMVGDGRREAEPKQPRLSNTEKAALRDGDLTKGKGAEGDEKPAEERTYGDGG